MLDQIVMQAIEEQMDLEALHTLLSQLMDKHQTSPQVIQSLNTIFREIVAAYEAEDYVYIYDQLQYNLRQFV